MRTGENMKADPVKACHAQLEPFRGTESPYRKLCPTCREGALLVRRDQGSMMLTNVDRCTHCGQVVVYSDRFINGEPVSHADEDGS